MPPRVKLADVRHLLAPEDAAAATPKRRGKYNSRPTEYRGIRYDSKAEADHAAALDLRVAAGEVLWWLRQIHFPLGDDSLRVDFLVCEPGGMLAEEVKGAETRDWLRKARLWPLYAPIPLRVFTKGEKRVIHCRSSDRLDAHLGRLAWGRGPSVKDRWDLLSVSDLGLARETWGAMYCAGVYTAGHAWKLGRAGTLAEIEGVGEAGARAAADAIEGLLAAIRAELDAAGETSRHVPAMDQGESDAALAIGVATAENAGRGEE